MARKPSVRSRAGRAAPRARTEKPCDRILDVTVVLLENGHPSTAIGPIEVFHSAGFLWNWLHGETQQPRFRMRTASIAGRSVDSRFFVRPGSSLRTPRKVRSSTSMPSTTLKTRPPVSGRSLSRA